MGVKITTSRLRGAVVEAQPRLDRFIRNGSVAAEMPERRKNSRRLVLAFMSLSLIRLEGGMLGRSGVGLKDRVAKPIVKLIDWAIC